MFKTKHSLRTTVLAPAPIGVQGLSQSPKDTSQAGLLWLHEGTRRQHSSSFGVAPILAQLWGRSAEYLSDGTHNQQGCNHGCAVPPFAATPNRKRPGLGLGGPWAGD